MDKLNAFADVYSKTLGEEAPPKVQLKEINNHLLISQKYIPKDVTHFLIYADQLNSFQGDLMFEPYVNSKKEKILQAILIIINNNMRCTFVCLVDYCKNYKGMEVHTWTVNSSRILFNNKNSTLVVMWVRE